MFDMKMYNEKLKETHCTSCGHLGLYLNKARKPVFSSDPMFICRSCGVVVCYPRDLDDVEHTSKTIDDIEREFSLSVLVRKEGCPYCQGRLLVEENRRRGHDKKTHVRWSITCSSCYSSACVLVLPSERVGPLARRLVREMVKVRNGEVMKELDGD